MKKYILIILTLFFGFKGFAQKAPPNMPHFDNIPFHFGITLGVSSLSSNLSGATELPLYDSIYGFSSVRNAGVQFGVITDLKLFETLHLRFIPTLVLSDRGFEYNVVRHGELKDLNNSLEVIYLEAPLELKFMSKRYGNFRSYLLGGFKYAYDFGSMKRKKLRPDEYLMKVEQHEYFYTLGLGFDFYLYRCKISLELKSSFGINDVLNHGFKNAYTDCLDKIKTQLFYININFEA
ncbi:MAG: outer membrane beta-barrel protein [Bacteroidales bacterium]|nr:outer membrane beta-barrel protein [Bacteroidales bacterium]